MSKPKLVIYLVCNTLVGTFSFCSSSLKYLKCFQKWCNYINVTESVDKLSLTGFWNDRLLTKIMSPCVIPFYTPCTHQGHSVEIESSSWAYGANTDANLKDGLTRWVMCTRMKKEQSERLNTLFHLLYKAICDVLILAEEKSANIKI